MYGNMMHAHPEPDRADIERLAARVGLSLRGDDAESYRALVEANLGLIASIEVIAPEPPAIPERAWRRPPDSENPLGAWSVKTAIRGAARGKLAGRRVVIKDNLLLAGVPLLNGTPILEGYVPSVDATVVTRVLDAGGEIVGKAVCEAYCFSGGSHTSWPGPVRNPRDPRRSAGGSSSGCGALVAAGEVDLAIGCDQGGSVRMPASFCGIYGLKPTHGLVPYTGILGMDPTIDHAGPMTGSVRDNALLLEVIAGADGVDSRQYAPRTEAYTEALGSGIEGMRIGVLREGFGLDGAEPDVDAKVLKAAQRLQKLGARVRDVSVPLHRAGAAIGFACLPSVVELMFHTDGFALGRQDPVDVGYLRAQRRWRERADQLPENVKVFLLVCEHLKRTGGYEYAARGQALVLQLRAAYDAALGEVDLLLLPTTPIKAPLLPPRDAPRGEILAAATVPLPNTMPFDNTHHPALSVPCGRSEGLPVGMMLVGRPFEETTLYRAAYSFEQHEDWRAL
jgi:amidase